MNRIWLAIVLTATTLSAASAGAQVAPYAMFSAGHYSGLGVGNGTSSTQSGGITSLGGTFGVYDDYIYAGPARFGPDARLMVQNSANSTPYGNKLTGFLVGGRADLAGLPAIPFNPYLQFEIGGVATNNGTSYNKSTSFAYQFQFGGDITILPHLATRLEYGAGQLETGNPKHTLQTFGAGLVVRLF
jgi:hypothetical protein